MEKGLKKLSEAIGLFIMSMFFFVLSWEMGTSTTHEKMPKETLKIAAFRLQQDLKVVTAVLGIICLFLSFLFIVISLFQLKNQFYQNQR